jgi:hypothetical protein
MIRISCTDGSACWSFFLNYFAVILTIDRQIVNFLQCFTPGTKAQYRKEVCKKHWVICGQPQFQKFRYKSPVQKRSVQETLDNLWATPVSEINLSVFESLMNISSSSEHFQPWYLKSQDSVVSIMTGVLAVGPTQPPAVGIRSKGAGAWSWPFTLLSTKVKNGWSCTSTPSYSFMALQG